MVVRLYISRQPSTGALPGSVGFRRASLGILLNASERAKAFGRMSDAASRSVRPDCTSLLQKQQLSIAYFPMRIGFLWLFCFLVSGGFVSAQTPKSKSPSPSPQPTLPEFRPALIGTAPNSLIN